MCVLKRQAPIQQKHQCDTDMCWHEGGRVGTEVTFVSIQSLTTDEFQNLCHGHLGSKVTCALVALKHGCIQYLIMNCSLLVDLFCLCLQCALS